VNSDSIHEEAIDRFRRLEWCMVVVNRIIYYLRRQTMLVVLNTVWNGMRLYTDDRLNSRTVQ
jgi:hypothetical protein